MSVAKLVLEHMRSKSSDFQEIYPKIVTLEDLPKFLAVTIW